MANTWSTGVWGQNEWGDQGPVVFTPSGQSATSSVGSVLASAVVTASLTGLPTTSSVGSLAVTTLKEVALTAPSGLTSGIGSVIASNFEGWGRQSWGNSAWGVEYAVALTGLSTTSTLGIAGLIFGTGNTEPITGQSTTLSQGSITLELETFVNLTGLQAQTELGDFDNAGTLVGWGRNGWGEEPYGDSFNKLVQLSSLTSMTASEGDIAPADVMGLTGVQSTSSVGSLGLAFGVSTEPITGVSSTSNLGGIGLAFGSSTEPITGVSSTSSTGSINVEIGVPLTGVSATSSIGSVQITINPIILPVGFETTSSLGSLGSIPDMQVGLTGLNTTASTGTLAPADVMGLTGVLATSSLNASGLILKYYGTITPKTSTGYSTKTPKTSTGYTIKTPA